MGIADLLNKLQNLLQQKQGLMQQVLQLSQRLVKEGEEYRQLEKLLDARQQYMDSIDQLDQQIHLLKEKIITAAGVSNWHDVKQLQPQVVASIENTVSNIKAIAGEAHQLTEQSREMAAAQLKQLQQKFKKLQSSKNGFSAYQHKTVQASGYFLDKKK